MKSNEYSDETSLKEIIEIIFKRKHYILCSVAVCVLVVAILSFVVIPPVYESSSTYMVSPVVLASGINPQSTVIINADTESLDRIRNTENKVLGSILMQLEYPEFDMNSIVNQLNSAEYLLGILKANKIDLDKYDYKKKISITYDVKKALMVVKVKHVNPDTAKKIKDEIIGKAPALITKQVNKKLDEIDLFLSNGLADELNNKGIIGEKLSGIMSQTVEANTTPAQKREYDQLIESDQLSGQAIYSYELISKELKDIRRIDIASRMNIHQIADDKLPLQPISPKKTLNMVVSVLLGIMIGLFLIFSTDYFQREFRSKP